MFTFGKDRTHLSCAGQKKAERFAIDNYSAWNRSIGFSVKHPEISREIEMLIRDSVKIGYGLASGESIHSIMQQMKCDE